MNKFALVVATLCLSSGCTELQQLAAPSEDPVQQQSAAAPTTAEISDGLKGALQLGVAHAVRSGSARDGFYANELIKIGVPSEAEQVVSTLRKFGMSAMVDDFELSLNRAAEQASSQAAGIFMDAVTEMTIVDVVDVWQGGDDAATQYLRSTSSAQLEQAFSPIIDQAIASAGVTRYWETLAAKYNNLPFVSPVTPDLNQYVNDKTMDGLFLLVAQEEQNIREHPAARSTDLLQRVFGYSQQYAAH